MLPNLSYNNSAMIKLFTTIEFQNAKVIDNLPLQCKECGQTFYKPKKYIQIIIKGNTKKTGDFCSNKCAIKHTHAPPMQVNCLKCGKEFYKLQSEIKNHPNNFCSRSCSASFNNALYPKKKKMKIRFCEKCKKEISTRRKYCHECDSKSKLEIDNRTLGEYREKRRYQAHSQIREKSRSVYNKSGKPKCCVYCGYDKHFDVCHIKSIESFDLETPVSIINDISNLIGLCKNHHWEFDHGILSFEEILARAGGIEPSFAAPITFTGLEDPHGYARA